ncbi:hypothetical protein EI94DRAFT_1583587 [Lactarius quietus]|nr:hypothetical protein EI94DRAFT_1583587 [Lactarius quietus]
MLEFSLQYREALDAITSDRDMKLCTYKMDKDKWEIACQLCEVLKIFKDATLFFSRDGVPNLATMIPAMDHIDEVLATHTTNRQFSISIQVALTVGKRTLNHYYSKTDFSEVYGIAMVLHPCHKLEYFKNAGWSDKWHTTAHQIVHDTFELNYKSFRSHEDESTVET